jgi:hypothetical protein
MKEEKQPDLPSEMRKMLEQNAKAAAKLTETAAKARAHAARELEKARVAHAKTVAQADAIRAKYKAEFLKHYKADFLASTQDRLVPKLHESGYTVPEIAGLVPLSEAAIQRILNRNKEPIPIVQVHDLIEGQIAKISYTSQGRGGDVLVEWGGNTLKLWWEFGGGDTVAFIDIPRAADWEARTGISLAEREQVLNIIGKSAVRDQSPSGHYAITDAHITIY